MKKLRAIDACSGAGGWACAARGLPIEIVAAFDREADALATYKLNHPAVETVLCDVVAQDFARWQGVDLILAGIPCETLSPARNNCPPLRRELSELRALLKKLLELPAQLNARWYCFEDVLQLGAWLPRRTPRFQLDAASWSPQSRKRLYVGNTPSPGSGNCVAQLRDVLRPGPHRLSGRIFGKRRPEPNGKSRTTFKPWFPDAKSKTVLGFSSRRDAEMATPHPLGWRQLEWQELAALQGFPSDYLFIGNPGRVAKMIGQAIQVDTGAAILRALCADLRAQGILEDPGV